MMLRETNSEMAAASAQREVRTVASHHAYKASCNDKRDMVQ